MKKKISIVLNLYLPKREVLEKILKIIKEQKINLDFEIIFINKKLDNDTLKLINKFKSSNKERIIRIVKVKEDISFAASMNIGIKAANSQFVVILQQDCIPSSDNWLRRLVNPLKKRKAVASVSNVRFPDELWNKLGIFTKSLLINERGVITPLLDEKGCAYKKEILKKVGMFDEKNFKTSGEDVDLYIKLKSEGEIAYPNAEIFHFHPTNLTSRLRKIKQWANGGGALIRKYRVKLPGWYFVILKSIPIIGLFGYLVSYPWKKGISLYFAYILMTPALHIQYISGFWKGFLMGKQTV